MSLDNFLNPTVLFSISGIPITLNSGNVTDTTIRAVLTNDVPLPAGTNLLGSVTVANPVLQVSGIIQVSGTTAIVDPLPAGNNNIGDVDIVSLPNEGQQTMANSISVAIASDQSVLQISGTIIVSGRVAIADPLPAGSNIIGSVNINSLPNEGQQTMANSISVAIASDQSVLQVSGTIIVSGRIAIADPLPTGSNTIGTVIVSGRVAIADPLPAGTNTLGTVIVSGRVAIADPLPAGTNLLGSVDINSLPNEGQQTMANSISVAIASNQSVLQISGNVIISGLVGIVDNGGSITVDGSVTANAGTNLNTSLLALEAGGNLAGAATSLAILDDWDETDRAKVNIIVGQAGVSANAGVLDATTQRITIATNDSVASGIGVMAQWDSNDRCRVDIISGQVAITAGAGSVAANTPRFTLASDDPAVASLSVLDDWDESDRAKVNIIVGQAGVSAGAGVIDATTQRITIATNDSVSSGIGVMTQWDSNDRCRVDLISGQVAISAGAGSVAANTPRFTLASDDPAVASLSVLDDWDNGASDGCSVAGDVAHDSPDAGEPVKIGYKAIAHGTNPTAVTANDRTQGYANRHGIPWVIGGHPNILTSGINYTTSQSASGLVTVATGNKIILTMISVFCDNANTVDVSATVGFGTSIITRVVGTHPGISPGSGFVLGNGAGIVGMGADDEDLRFTCEVPTGGSINVNFGYYTVES